MLFFTGEKRRKAVQKRGRLFFSGENLLKRVFKKDRLPETLAPKVAQGKRSLPPCKGASVEGGEREGAASPRGGFSGKRGAQRRKPSACCPGVLGGGKTS